MADDDNRQTQALEVERVPIDSIVPDPANVRLHPERNLDAIRSSLRRFGQQKPIVVDTNGTIRAGNGTWLAAMKEGWVHIDVVRSDLTPAEITAYAIADNRSSELAEWHQEALHAILLEYDQDLLAATGFDQKELESLSISPNWEPLEFNQNETTNLTEKLILEINDLEVRGPLKDAINELLAERNWLEAVTIIDK